MSHIVQIATQVRDVQAARAGCKRLGLQPPSEGTFELFSQSATGLGVQLKAWRYPVVFDLKTGQSQFDNYQGHWGQRARLDEFLQAYAVEKTKLEARRKGYSVSEQTLADGRVMLSLTMES